MRATLPSICANVPAEVTVRRTDAAHASPPATEVSAQDNGNAHAEALTRLAALAGSVDGATGRELRTIAETLQAEFVAERVRMEALSLAQADALVNSAMMMTALQDSQVELERARALAEAASRSKSEFLANMSHEIRTPINGVLGMNEILMRTELNAKQHRCAVTIRNSVEALLRVINDILDFSKIESGKLELHEAPFDLRDVIEELVELYAENARQRGVALNAVLPVSMPTRLIGDDGRLRQVLTNLVGNALKFTHDGEVIIRVGALRERDDGRVELRIDVTDSGIGIAPEARARIFDAFTQADGTTQRRFGGTGLGLAISSQLVRYMGGEIHVDSELDRGSTFWFTICCQRDTAEYPEDEAPDALNGMRVLAVDDNETNRAIYQDQLGHWNCEFETAFDGAHALERLRLAAQAERPFELVILDMHMPGMDGLELARRIVNDPTIPTPVQVMLSSMSDQMSAAQYREHGITHYLTKPVRHMDLYRCLRRLRVGEAPLVPGANKVPPALPQVHGRVLVAEDNLVNQEIIRDLLDLDGLEVVVVGDGQQAVEAVAAGRHDLIFMDCQMPVMDGYLATAAIRAIDAERGGARSVIVALTANALEGDRERCLAAGMDDYLSKPFKVDALHAVLIRWLPVSPGKDGICSPLPQSDTAAPAKAADATVATLVLDPDALAPFVAREQGARPGVLKRIVCGYLEQSASLMLQMENGVGSGDFEAVRQSAHALKSSSAVIGAESFATLCREIEEACRRGDTHVAAQHVPQALTLFAAVAAALRAAYPQLLT